MEQETVALLKLILEELRKLNSKKEAVKRKRAELATGNFLEFWESYPRKKTGRIAAERAYEKALSVSKHEEIMEGVKAFAMDLKKNPRETNLIPHHATWLNHGRWMDEYESRPAVKQPVKSGFDQSKEDESEKNRRLSEEWTDQKIASLPQQDTDAIKKEVFETWKEAITMKPSMARHFYRREIRKRYDCPYIR